MNRQVYVREGGSDRLPCAFASGLANGRAMSSPPTRIALNAKAHIRLQRPKARSISHSQ